MDIASSLHTGCDMAEKVIAISTCPATPISRVTVPVQMICLGRERGNQPDSVTRSGCTR